MPPTITYPPRPGTISDGHVQTISAYLNQPDLITRRLRTLTEQRFIGDRMLRGTAIARGGMVKYAVSESIYPLGAPKPIDPKGKYPLSRIDTGTLTMEALQKEGLATDVSLESVQDTGMEPVERAEVKLSNVMVQYFDELVVSKVDAAVTQSITGTNWQSAGGYAILRQTLLAKALIRDLRQGYSPKALLLTTEGVAIVMSDEKLQSAIQRVPSNDVFGGVMTTFADLEIIEAPSDLAITDPVVFDADQLGSIVRPENEVGADTNGVSALSQYFTFSADGDEFWRIGVKRRRLPIIQEPAAACRITGTGL
jgi:hypothetical protein